MIKTIIFDYAGVITPTPDKMEFARKNHLRFGVSVEELLRVFYKNFDRAAVNEISEKEYWEMIGEELKIDPLVIRQEIIEAFPEDPRVVELIKKLKTDYQLIMMSNQIEDWLEEVIDQNSLRGSFDFFLNSYQVKFKKPDEQIFRLALEKSRSKPEEILFIDDRRENVEAAGGIGIQTIQFKSYEQFMDELELKLGKLPEY